MTGDLQFTMVALAEGLDISYNTGSKYFNSKETRIAYYKFKGEI